MSMTWEDITNQAKIQAKRFVPEYDPAIDLDDLVQEIMLAVWRHEQNITGTNYPPNYLARIVRNTCLKYLRKIRYIPHDPTSAACRTNSVLPISIENYSGRVGINNDPYQSPLPSVEEVIIGRERLISVMRAASPEQARVLFPFFQGYSNREIARALHLASSTVTKNIQRAILKAERQDHP